MVGVGKHPIFNFKMKKDHNNVFLNTTTNCYKKRKKYRILIPTNVLSFIRY